MASPLMLGAGALLVAGALIVAALELRDGDGNDDAPGTRARSAVDSLAEHVAVLRSPSYLAGAKAVAVTLAVLPVALLTPVVRALPATWRLYRRLAVWSTYQIQRAAGADAVANVRRSSGKEDLRPAAWIQADEDEKEKSGWAVLGIDGKRYDPSVHGRDTTRMGKADMLHLDEDETEVGTWGECTMDNALQLDRERYLFRDARVSVGEVVLHGGGNGALPDGGQAQADAKRVSIEKPGILSDALVPLSSREGWDGQVVSWNQYQSAKQERSDQETIRDAKNSAWTAAKLDDIEGMDLVKAGVAFVVWSLLLLFKDSIAAAISNFGGGSGGSSGNAVGGAAGAAGDAISSGMIHFVDVVAMLGGV